MDQCSVDSDQVKDLTRANLRIGCNSVKVLHYKVANFFLKKNLTFLKLMSTNLISEQNFGVPYGKFLTDMFSQKIRFLPRMFKKVAF